MVNSLQSIVLTLYTVAIFSILHKDFNTLMTHTVNVKLSSPPLIHYEKKSENISGMT